MDQLPSFAASPAALRFGIPPRRYLSPRQPRNQYAPWRRQRAQMMTAVVGDPEMPAALRNMVRSFASVPDTKLRYQQLLFFAQQLPPMDPALKTDKNLVRGCQSVVHIDISLDDAGCVSIQADSDAQLTKGLVALLVRGFEGASPAEVLATDDGFLATSGLAIALTPARNNGFANALALVKTKVRALADARNAPAPPPAAKTLETKGPTYNAILRKLAVLEPESIDVVDESAQHSSHAAMRNRKRETHFAVDIVSPMFEELSLVQRHRLVYKLLEDEMVPGKIHALKIEARTPAEVS